MVFFLQSRSDDDHSLWSACCSSVASLWLLSPPPRKWPEALQTSWLRNFLVNSQTFVEMPPNYSVDEDFFFIQCNAWMSSLFIKFQFHRASKLQVLTHSEFKFLPFFEFTLEFGAMFSKILARIFWVFQVLWSSNYQIIELKFDRTWNLSA